MLQRKLIEDLIIFEENYLNEIPNKIEFYTLEGECINEVEQS